MTGTMVQGGRDKNEMRRLLVWSVAVHIVLVLVLTVFAGESEDDYPQERMVKLMLHQRVVSKDIVPDPPQESAPGQDKDKSDSIFDESFFKPSKDQLQKRNSIDATEPRDRDSRDKGDDARYDRLQKAPDDKHGRLNRSSGPSTDDYPGRRDLNKDRDTRSGDDFSLGRDPLRRTGDNRDPLRDSGSRRANQGNKGSGITGNVNVRGRRVVYSPVMVLPDKYKQRGLSFYVTLNVVVTPEGLVSSASVVGTTGDPELDRIVVQFARRYRLEPVSTGLDQSGTIGFQIRPQ